MQLTVFVGGGVVCPVAHMAWHRPGHSHGAAGQAVAFTVSARIGAAGDPSSPGLGRRRPDERGPRHEHSHPHSHSHPPAPARPLPTSGPDGDAHAASGGEPPLDSGHGHGSIAHLGLALLSAGPPMALPLPAPAGLTPLAAHPRPAALFRPAFPLSRPPPAAASS